jgi:hypothetical protein
MKRNDGVSLDELQVLTGKSKDWVRDRLRVQPPGYEHDLHHVLNRCPGERFTARPIGCSSYSGRVSSATQSQSHASQDCGDIPDGG